MECNLCHTRLRPFTKHLDWSGREYHKKCFKSLNIKKLNCITCFYCGEDYVFDGTCLLCNKKTFQF